MRSGVLAGAFFALVSTMPPSARADAVKTCVDTAEQAQKLRSSGQLLLARDRFAACGRDECPAVIARDCLRWAAEVTASMPSVVFGARDEDGRDIADVRVFVDSAPLVQRLSGTAVDVDPGEHTFRFERPGAQNVVRHVLVRQGEKDRLVLVDWPRRLAPPPEPLPSVSTPPSRWAFVLAGASVLSFAAFAGFGIKATNDLDGLRSSCGMTRSCSDSEISRVKTEYWVADISFVVGLALAGAATWLFLSHPEKTSPMASRTP